MSAQEREALVMFEHGSDLATRFLPGTWPRCVCGFDPRDNRLLSEHFAEYGFREVDAQGEIVRKPAPTAGVGDEDGEVPL